MPFARYARWLRDEGSKQGHTVGRPVDFSHCLLGRLTSALPTSHPALGWSPHSLVLLYLKVFSAQRYIVKSPSSPPTNIWAKVKGVSQGRLERPTEAKTHSSHTPSLPIQGLALCDKHPKLHHLIELSQPGKLSSIMSSFCKDALDLSLPPPSSSILALPLSPFSA